MLASSKRTGRLLLSLSFLAENEQDNRPASDLLRTQDFKSQPRWRQGAGQVLDRESELAGLVLYLPPTDCVTDLQSLSFLISM